MRKLAVVAFILFASTSAFAQRNSVSTSPMNLMREKGPDAYTQQKRKDIEDDYNAAMKKIPDKPKQSSDPWGKLRGANETKGQSPK